MKTEKDLSQEQKKLKSFLNDLEKLLRKHSATISVQAFNSEDTAPKMDMAITFDKYHVEVFPTNGEAQDGIVWLDESTEYEEIWE